MLAMAKTIVAARLPAFRIIRICRQQEASYVQDKDSFEQSMQSKQPAALPYPDQVISEIINLKVKKLLQQHTSCVSMWQHYSCKQAAHVCFIRHTSVSLMYSFIVSSLLKVLSICMK